MKAIPLKLLRPALFSYEVSVTNDIIWYLLQYMRSTSGHNSCFKINSLPLFIVYFLTSHHIYFCQEAVTDITSGFRCCRKCINQFTSLEHSCSKVLQVQMYRTIIMLVWSLFNSCIQSVSRDTPKNVFLLEKSVVRWTLWCISFRIFFHLTISYILKIAFKSYAGCQVGLV